MSSMRVEIVLFQLLNLQWQLNIAESCSSFPYKTALISRQNSKDTWLKCSGFLFHLCVCSIVCSHATQAHGQTKWWLYAERQEGAVKNNRRNRSILGLWGHPVLIRRRFIRLRTLPINANLTLKLSPLWPWLHHKYPGFLVWPGWAG